jgi:hypothetical protein
VIDERVVGKRATGDRQRLAAGRIGEGLQDARYVVDVREAVADEQNAGPVADELRARR